MSYHVVKDHNGLLRATSYKQIWSEVKQDDESNLKQTAYPVYGITVEGKAYLLGVFEELKEANLCVEQHVQGLQERAEDGTSLLVEI